MKRKILGLLEVEFISYKYCLGFSSPNREDTLLTVINIYIQRPPLLQRLLTKKIKYRFPKQQQYKDILRNKSSTPSTHHHLLHHPFPYP